MSIQHMPVRCEALGQFSKNFSTGQAIHRANPAPTPREKVVGQQQHIKGGWGRAKQPGFSCTSSSLVARNVKRFPRKFLLLQEDREGNQENFDTFQAVGVSMKKRVVKVLIGLLLAQCVNSMVEPVAESRHLLFMDTIKQTSYQLIFPNTINLL